MSCKYEETDTQKVFIIVVFHLFVLYMYIIYEFLQCIPEQRRNPYKSHTEWTQPDGEPPCILFLHLQSLIGSKVKASLTDTE